MTTSTIDASQRTAARVAGFACLFSFAIVIFAYYGISSRLVVAGNVAETARNIMAHERLFRVAIACNLTYVAGIVVLLTALYALLRPVNRSLALLAASARLVYVLMFLVGVLNQLDVLRLLSGADYLRVLETDHLHALVRLNLGRGFDAYYLGLPFFGLASTLCSYLLLKSSYVPRALALWGVISSAWCAASGLAFIIFPAFGKAINLYSLDTPMGLFEIVLSFWLLFRGLRPSGVAEPVRASH